MAQKLCLHLFFLRRLRHDRKAAGFKDDVSLFIVFWHCRDTGGRPRSTKQLAHLNYSGLTASSAAPKKVLIIAAAKGTPHNRTLSGSPLRLDVNSWENYTFRLKGPRAEPGQCDKMPALLYPRASFEQVTG